MITVFTSSFNHGKYLRQSIESVLNQKYQDFEYLIYDDGSTDDSWDIIEKYNKIDGRIKAFKLDKCKNVAEVVNKSLEIYKGDYWVWCPGDDKLTPNALYECSLLTVDHPNDVFYNDWLFIDLMDNVIGSGKFHVTPEEFNEEVWRSSPICFVGIWIPRTVWNLVGGFPEQYNYSEDFWWMIKATIDGVKFRHIPQYLHYRRNHANSTTHRNIDAILRQIPVIRAELQKYKESKK
jgi:glycosyltransferase involved in cell wall biosynthesis